MALLQKIVNVLVIVACTGLLISLNNAITEASNQQDELLEFTYLIGTGVALTDQQSIRIS
jgi:hypothetical protein